MVVRELLARLGLDIDRRSFGQADTEVNKVKGSVAGVNGAVQTMGQSLTSYFAGLGAAVGVAAVAFGIGKSIKYASDANETLNVLNASFEEGTPGVLAWAESFGGAAQRSQYQMREMAGTIGSVLNPMLGYNAAEASRMSMGLTELAVDLGSFYNATDDEALNALRSGIVGESEPLKKFGIVMLESTLSAYALEQGITKSYKSMSIAEKTQLRYNYLMSVTKLAQGDAIKTADGFANASKGLLGGLRDLATSIGMRVLPAITKITIVATKISMGFAKLVGSSHLVEAAMAVLGTAFVVWGAKSLIAILPTIAPFLLLAAAIGAAILVVDDFLTFLDGGESVIGEFINYLFGPGSATAAAEALRAGLSWVSDYFTEVFLPSLKLLPQAVKLMIADIKTFFSEGTTIIKDFVVGLIDGFGKIFGIDKLSDKLVGFAGKAIDAVGAFNDVLQAPGRKVIEVATDFLGEKIGLRKAEMDEAISEGPVAKFNRQRQAKKEATYVDEAAYSERVKSGRVTQSDIARLRQKEREELEAKKVAEIEEKQKAKEAKKESILAARQEKIDRIRQRRQYAEDLAYAKKHNIQLIPEISSPSISNNNSNKTSSVTINNTTNVEGVVSEAQGKKTGTKMNSALEQASRKAARLLEQTL